MGELRSLLFQGIGSKKRALGNYFVFLVKGEGTDLPALSGQFSCFRAKERAPWVRTVLGLLIFFQQALGFEFSPFFPPPAATLYLSFPFDLLMTCHRFLLPSL